MILSPIDIYKARSDKPNLHNITSGLQQYLRGKWDNLKMYLNKYSCNTTIPNEFKYGELYGNRVLLDIEEVNFDELDKDPVKVQNRLHDKHKNELLWKIMDE